MASRDDAISAISCEWLACELSPTRESFGATTTAGGGSWCTRSAMGDNSLATEAMMQAPQLQTMSMDKRACASASSSVRAADPALCTCQRDFADFVSAPNFRSKCIAFALTELTTCASTKCFLVKYYLLGVFMT